MNSFISLTEIFFLVHSLAFFYRRFFNVQMTILGCGIFGFMGPKKPNLAKIKILGIYNTKRGRDSCGYYYNGRVFKGTDKIKEWPDFIQNHTIIDVGKPKSNVFIGHNRMASSGSVTLENCHPFSINDKLILAHNGTLDNIWELCNKYDVDFTDIHVDSKALGILYAKVGPSILSEYRGYAALLIHDVNDPESLYAYHGASRKYNYEASPIEEERPLFYMETREGYYFSSLEEALEAIRDVEGQEPFQLEVNKLIKITGKEFKNMYDVPREWNNVGVQKKITTVVTPKDTLGQNASGHNTKVIDWRTAKRVANIKTSVMLLDNVIDIKDETVPCRFYDMERAEGEDKNFIFYWKGRYYDQDENQITGRVFLHAKHGTIHEEAAENIFEYYFYKGLLLNGKVAYERIMDAICEQNELGKQLFDPKENFAKIMSRYSRYPVTNMYDESCSITNEFVKQAWYVDNDHAKGGVSPIFCDRSYTFKAGNLVNIQNRDKEELRDVFLVDEANGVKKYVNSGYFDKPMPDVKKKVTKDNLVNLSDLKIISSHFDGGEFVEQGKPTEGSQTAKLMPFLNRVYKDLAEIEKVVPYQVYLAITYYLREVLESCANSYPITVADIDTSWFEFLSAALRDRVPFNQLFDPAFRSIESYLIQAITDYDIPFEEEGVEDKSFHITESESEACNHTAYMKALGEMTEESDEEKNEGQIFYSEEREVVDAAYKEEVERSRGKKCGRWLE